MHAAADPKSVWVVQAWAFGASYWTNERLEAYLSGVSNSYASHTRSQFVVRRFIMIRK